MTKKKTPWIPFYPSDWLAGTRGMSAAEAGIYITLISMMYENDGPLKFDNARMSRLCGASNSVFKRAIGNLIADGKILETDEGLWNERVGRELSYKREKASVATQSANARWEKDKKKQYYKDANAMRTQCKRNASHSHNHNNEITTAAAEKPREAAAPGFQQVGFRCLAAMGIDPRDPTWFGNIGICAQWLANGWDPDTDILPTIQAVMQRRSANGQGIPRTLNFFTNAIGEAFKARKAAGSSNVVGIQPDTEMCELANGKTIPRGVAYVRCFHYFRRVKFGERCPWTPTQQLEDKYPPGHPDCIYPQEIVDEARAAVDAEAKQQAAG